MELVHSSLSSHRCFVYLFFFFNLEDDSYPNYSGDKLVRRSDPSSNSYYILIGGNWVLVIVETACLILKLKLVFSAIFVMYACINKFFQDLLYVV